MAMNASMNECLSQNVLTHRIRRKEFDRREGRSMFYSLRSPACADSHILTFKLNYNARENGIYCSAICPITSLAKSDALRPFLDKINTALHAGEIHYMFLWPDKDCPNLHEAYISVGLGLKLDDANETDITPLLDKTADYLENVIVVMGEAILKIIGGGDAEALAQESIEKLPAWTGGFTPTPSKDMPIPAHLLYDEDEDEETSETNA